MKQKHEYDGWQIGPDEVQPSRLPPQQPDYIGPTEIPTWGKVALVLISALWVIVAAISERL